METSKEQMSKYLEKMQYLQRVCMGHTVYVESRNTDDEVSIYISVIWEDSTDTKCRSFYVCEWYDKERNDENVKNCVDFLTNTLNWI